jgi:hypothetical protein
MGIDGGGTVVGHWERHRALPKHKRHEVRRKAEPDAYRPAKSIHFRDMRASSTVCSLSPSSATVKLLVVV